MTILYALLVLLAAVLVTTITALYNFKLYSYSINRTYNFMCTKLIDVKGSSCNSSMPKILLIVNHFSMIHNYVGQVL